MSDSRPNQVLTYSSNRTVRLDAIFIVGVASLATLVAGAYTKDLAGTEPLTTFGGVTFVVFALLLVFLKQRIVEFDTASRRLRIIHRWFIGISKLVVDCSFDDCAVVGIAEHSSERGPVYGAYLRLKNGNRHPIPLKNGDTTFEEADIIIRKIIAATGIRRVDAN